MAQSRSPAELFPPGDYIREELNARRWTQRDLSVVLKRPLQAVNEMINGKKRITAETAKELAAAFNTSAELWLNLENAYRLSRATPPDPQIARRAEALLDSRS